jgi:hypothetical protein
LGFSSGLVLSLGFSAGFALLFYQLGIKKTMQKLIKKGKAILF